MVCREVRKRLTEFAAGSLTPIDEDSLRTHLRTCADCARWALAERLLADDIDQVRESQPHRLATLEWARESITVRNEQENNTSLGAQIMNQINDTIHRRPRLSLVTGMVTVLAIMSVLVPVSTEHSVGYEVAFAAPNSDLALNRESAEMVLAALNIDDAEIETSERESEILYTITPLKDSAQVQRLVVVLDSLGGRKVQSAVSAKESKNRTIWQLLLTDLRPRSGGFQPLRYDRDGDGTVTIDLKRRFKGDFVLWMPVGDKNGDSLRGLLLDRQGDKTDIRIIGESENMSHLAPDDCGWNQYLNNAVMHTQTPDGQQATFNLYDIADVRKLEKMGYNFFTMEFNTPGQVPIPGMGPKLNEVRRSKDAVVIEIMVPQAYEVNVQILDEDGREIRTLLDCISLAGIRKFVWDGRDEYGNLAEPGNYVCRFTAGDYTESQEFEFDR